MSCSIVDRSKQIVNFVQQQLSFRADSGKAVEMAAYMKTDMPFYGVQKPDRLPIYKQLFREFEPLDRDDYEAIVRALWNLPHREEKYTALEYANAFQQFVTGESLPLFEDLIRTGARWDFVDVVAINLVGHAYMKERASMKSVIERFSNDRDLWIRRTSLICQNHHKKKTDEAQLFRLCLKLAPEKEFFIRKAIGWALREYSYVAPAAVRAFVSANEQAFSPLSRREALKRLK